MSDASKGKLRYKDESSYGIVPSGTYKDLRMTSEGLKQDTEYRTSDEIDPGLEVTDVRRVGLSAAGPVNGQLSYGTYDDWLQYLLLSAGWSTPETHISSANTISFESIATSSSSYAKIKDSANGLASYDANQWIRVSGASTAGNNGYCKIVSVSAGELEVSHIDFSNEAASASVTILEGGQIVNGTTLTTMTIEREYTDLSGEFAQFPGSGVSQVQIGLNDQALLTIAFQILAKLEQSAGSSAASGNTPANSNGIFNATDHALVLHEGGSSHDLKVFSVQINQPLRARTKIGTLGAFSMGVGRFAITASWEAFYDSKTQYDKYLNATATDVAIAIQDDAGNGYVIELPRVRLTSGDRSVPGNDQDVFRKMEATSYKHATEAVSVRIARFAA